MRGFFSSHDARRILQTVRPEQVLSLFFISIRSAESPARQGIARLPRTPSRLPGLHDPLSSCYHVQRSNSNSPAFHRASRSVQTWPAVRGTIGIEQFLYKKACRSFTRLISFSERRIKHRANQAPAFFVSSLSAAHGHASSPQRPHASAPLPRPRRCNSQHNLDECFFANRSRGTGVLFAFFAP